MIIRLRLATRRRLAAVVRLARYLFLALGIGALGYCGWAYFDAYISQVRDERAFDRELGGLTTKAEARAGATASVVIPYHGLIGRLTIPRLGMNAIVREGVDSGTLRKAIGHIPGTALPGAAGNVAVAAHRDSFFRGLKDIHRNDIIRFETPHGAYEYVVDSLQIVQPDDVAVLRASGFNTLTLVTCYPFYYVGAAPRRFIVKAREVPSPAEPNVSSAPLPGS
ncbi:MAG: class D sortase [Bryobacteraceae bacterium]